MAELLLYIPLFILGYSQSGHCPGEGRLGMVILLYALLLPHLLLGTFLLFLGTAHINIFRSLCGIHEQCDTVVYDLCEPGSDRQISPLIFACKLYFCSTYRK